MNSGKARLTKYLVLAAVCAAIFFLSCRAFIPWAGTSDLTRVEWPPVVPTIAPEEAKKNVLDRVVLVVASQMTDNTTWLHTGFPTWEKWIYLTDTPSNLSVPVNKGREGMVYLR